jgi:hypothetical protein
MNYDSYLVFELNNKDALWMRLYDSIIQLLIFMRKHSHR